MHLYDKPADLTVEQLAQNAAVRARSGPPAVLSAMQDGWKKTVTSIFGTTKTTAAQNLEALGANAGELMDWIERVQKFLENEKPGCTKIPESNLIKPHTKNPDGTVTLKS